MKISNNFKAILTAATLSLGLFSCSKFDDNNYEPIQVSGLNVIQASPTTELLDVYVNNNRANDSDFTFGSKIGYLSAYSGIRTFSIAKRNSGIAIKTVQQELKPTIGYSLFVANTLANIEFLIVEDNLTKPATGKAKVRFVNTSPDAGALSLYVNDVKVDIAANKSFKEYSIFAEVDATQSTVITLKDVANNVEATIPDVKLEDGKIYTIFAKGLKANIDETKFAGAIFTHTNY